MGSHRGRQQGSYFWLLVWSWAGPLLYLGWPWLVTRGAAALVIEAVWLAVTLPFGLRWLARHRNRTVRAPGPPARALGASEAACGPGPRVPLPAEVKVFVWDRDGGQCRQCRIRDEVCMAVHGEHLQYDHVIPWSRGGSNSRHNIQLLCPSDNRAKAARMPVR